VINPDRSVTRQQWKEFYSGLRARARAWCGDEACRNILFTDLRPVYNYVWITGSFERWEFLVA